MIIIGNGTLITRNTDNEIIENGAVAISGNSILQAGDTKQIRDKYPQARFIDACDGIIMPGLINAHNHIYSAFARGLSVKGYSPRSFTDILEGLWWNLDRNLLSADTYYSAMVTYIDCIKNGCTTVFDHHASYGETRGSLFQIAQAASKLGVRTCLCYEVSDRNGEEKMREAVAENTEFIKYAENDKTDMIKGMMGLHASFTLSDSTMSLCKENTPGDAGFHIHVAEGTVDEEDCLANYGKRVIERLQTFDMLGGHTVAGHCIHINEKEMELLSKTKTIVVHNPESNMGNAVGIPPCIDMMRRNILLGLGTDGYTNDMFESQKVANVIHKHVTGDPQAAWSEVPQMLYYNNAEICRRFFTSNIGVLEAGAAADIIVSDYNPPTPLCAGNIDSHTLFGMSGRSVTTTVINGCVKMENRKLCDIDEDEIYSKARECAGKLWKRINTPGGNI